MPKTQLNIIDQNDGKVILFRNCPLCGHETRIEVDAKKFYDGVEKYKAGALIQNAFPFLDAKGRELIMTGMCGKCWDSM